MSWSGMGELGGGGWRPLELQLEGEVLLGGGRPGIMESAGILRKPYASHKSYNGNVECVPVVLNLTCTLNPLPYTKSRLNAGST